MDSLVRIPQVRPAIVHVANPEHDEPVGPAKLVSRGKQ
jgi:hypothetical protein